jgi:hypothetical protein
MSAEEMGLSRRHFLGTVGASVVSVGDAASARDNVESQNPNALNLSRPGRSLKPGICDGPRSPLFTPISLPGNTGLKGCDRASAKDFGGI